MAGFFTQIYRRKETADLYPYVNVLIVGKTLVHPLVDSSNLLVMPYARSFDEMM